MTDPDHNSFPDRDLMTRALQERLVDEPPDLDRLTAGAMRVGARMRRRRRAAVALSTVAVVGVVAAGYAGLGGRSAEPHQASDIPAAAADSASGSPTVAPSPTTDPCSAGAGSVQVRVTDGPSGSVERQDAEGCPLPPEAAPVSLDGDQFRCDEAADEKFGCLAIDSKAVFTVTWRAASGHDDYLDPGKTGRTVTTIAMLGGEGIVKDDGTIVGPVHDGIFVTVSADPAHLQEAQLLAAALAWAEAN